jgi:hypothetical protein
LSTLLNTSVVENTGKATDISAIQDASEIDLKHARLGLKDTGDYNEIVSVIFARTGGNVKNKPILDALISIGKNRFDWEMGKAQWFKASKQALIAHIMESGSNFNELQKESQIKKVGRCIKRLVENQEKAGVTWVEYKPGGKNFQTGKAYSSEFRLVILEHVVEAYLRVKADPQRYATTGPGSKFKNAALEVAAEYSRENPPAPKPKKKQTPDYVRSQAQGSVLRWLGMLIEQGQDYEAVASAFQHFYAVTLSRLISEDRKSVV